MLTKFMQLLLLLFVLLMHTGTRTYELVGVRRVFVANAISALSNVQNGDDFSADI